MKDRGSNWSLCPAQNAATTAKTALLSQSCHQTARAQEIPAFDAPTKPTDAPNTRLIGRHSNKQEARPNQKKTHHARDQSPRPGVAYQHKRNSFRKIATLAPNNAHQRAPRLVDAPSKATNALLTRYIKAHSNEQQTGSDFQSSQPGVAYRRTRNTFRKIAIYHQTMHTKETQAWRCTIKTHTRTINALYRGPQQRAANRVRLPSHSRPHSKTMSTTRFACRHTQNSSANSNL